MVFPAWWKDPAHRTSKCGKSCHSQDAQENERTIQAKGVSPGDCMPPTAGIVYRAGFVVHAAVKPGQDTDADAECECQNDPETGQG